MWHVLRAEGDDLPADDPGDVRLVRLRGAARSVKRSAVTRLMHDVAEKNVKDQQEDQRNSDDEQHDADSHVNQAAVIGQPIVPHFALVLFCVFLQPSNCRTSSRTVGMGAILTAGHQDDRSVSTSATKPSLWRAWACERDDLLFDPRLRRDEECTQPCQGGHREPQRHHDHQAKASNCSREGFCFGESEVMWQITRGWSL